MPERCDIAVHLDGASATPVYLQIGEQIRRQIVDGSLRPGDRLPPVRALATRLGVNANTIAHAYAALASDGLALCRRGGGTTIATAASEAVRVSQAARLADLVDGALARAVALGFAVDDVEAAVALQATRWREHGPDTPLAQPASAAAGTVAFAGSHDLCFEALARQLARRHPPVRVAARYAGSLEGLVALVRGEADLAGCHLLDEETGDYNVPFVRRLLPGHRVRLLTLARRRQGLLVPRGNPRRLRAAGDLAQPGLTLANRQRGSGTRALLDLLLRRAGVDATGMAGYEREYPTHVAVASAVAEGAADAGLGIEAAAATYYLDFIPLADEPYELVLPADSCQRQEVEALVDVVRSSDFRRLVGAMTGYDATDTGKERVLG